MVYIVKLSFLIYMIILFGLRGAIEYSSLLMLLLIVFINIIMEKYFKNIYVIAASALITGAAVFMDSSFMVFLCLPVFDFTLNKFYIGTVTMCFFSAYEAAASSFPPLLIIVSLSTVLAYVMGNSKRKESNYISSLDTERQLRYELEQTKNKLLNASKEAAYIAEIRERNRIAREIHDNVGHSIAGILIQLQLAQKLQGSNMDKSREILDNSIVNLSDSLTLLRDTVHNIKPKENLGVEYIKNIIENFKFCPVDFKFTGDFGILPPSHMEIIGANIKEALTNASKHSGASNMDINIDINERFVRLYIRDNGNGCENIKEGLGLSGMRDRVNNMGGMLSISSEDGFMIVCLLPVVFSKGDDFVESIGS